jgi:hypothetical protein
VDGKNVIILTDGFGFVDSRGRVINIPRLEVGERRYGFVNDGGTVPRIGRIFFDPMGKYYPAFAIHDMDWSYRVVDFDASNRTLNDGLKVLGASRLDRRVIIRSIEVGGRGIWSRGAEHNADFSWHYMEII